MIMGRWKPMQLYKYRYINLVLPFKLSMIFKFGKNFTFHWIKSQMYEISCPLQLYGYVYFGKFPKKFSNI